MRLKGKAVIRMNSNEETVQTPQQRHQRRLLKKYGETVLKHGYTSIPNTLYEYHGELGLSLTEIGVIGHLWMCWWESLPHPTLALIARRAYRTERAIRSHISHLKQPKVRRDADGKEEQKRPAYLVVTERMTSHGQRSNTYDFSPLLDSLKALIERDEEGSVNSNARKVSSGPGRKVSSGPGRKVSSGPGRKVSSGPDEKTGDMHEPGEPQEARSGGKPSRARAIRFESYEDSVIDSIDSKGLRPSPENAGISEKSPEPEPEPEPEIPVMPESIGREIRRISRDFGDASHIKANVTQAGNLYGQVARRGMSAADFAEIITGLEKLTSQANNIRRKDHATGAPNRMPYFFSLLRSGTAQLIEQWDAEDAASRELRETQRLQRTWKLMQREFPADYDQYLALYDAGRVQEAESFLAPFCELADEAEAEKERRWQESQSQQQAEQQSQQDQQDQRKETTV